MKKILLTVLLLCSFTCNVLTGNTVFVQADSATPASDQVIQFTDVDISGGTYEAVWHSTCPFDLSDCQVGPSSDTVNTYGLTANLFGGGPDYNISITVAEGDVAPSSPVDVYVFLDNGVKITGTANANYEIIAATGSSISVSFDADKCIEKIQDDDIEAPFLLKWEVHDNIGNWFYYDSPENIYGSMLTAQQFSWCGIMAVSGQMGDTWVSVSADASGKFIIVADVSQIKVSADGYADTVFVLEYNLFGLKLTVEENGNSRENRITASIKDGTSHKIQAWVLNTRSVKAKSQIDTTGDIGDYLRAEWILDAYEAGDSNSLNYTRLAYQYKNAGNLNFFYYAPNETKDYLIVAIADPNEGETGRAFAYYTFHVEADPNEYTEVADSTVPGTASTETADLSTVISSKLFVSRKTVGTSTINLIDVEGLFPEELTIQAEVLSDNIGKDIIGTEAKIKDIVSGASLNPNTGIFEKNGKAIQNQFVEDAEGNTYFTDENGKPVTDAIVTNGNKSYYFDKNGKTYVTNNNGVIQKNTITIYGKNMYYSNPDGTVLKNDTITRNGVTYWADKNGKLKELIK